MITEEDQGQLKAWLEEESGAFNEPDMHVIARIADGRIVAAFGLCRYNGQSVQLHAASLYRGAISHRLVATLADAIVNRLKAQVVFSIIDSRNDETFRMNTDFGLIRSGRIPNYYADGVDGIVMSMATKDSPYFKLAFKEAN